ncbi:MAG: hypothetical protein KJ072_10370 [Verrucomicrobia bacterium]|nr:hypothetical protein [Verrucomicrobiota bacterium]
MNSSSDIRFRLDAVFWYGGMFVVVFVLSVMLARNWFLAALIGGAAVWAIALPYHAPLALTISMATFNSALIVPFSPGPMTVTDAALLLAWSGVPLVIMLRRFPADTVYMVQTNKAIFAGVLIYLVALGTIIISRGVGFGFLGDSAGGGKVYFRQLVSVILPLLFVVTPVDERNFLRLATLYFMFSLTYLISDAVLAIMPGAANLILSMLQLPTDAAFFEFSTRQFGFRRLQSLFYVCPKIVFALLMYFSLKDVLGRRAWWLIPTILAILAAGLGSGHRANLIHTGVVMIVLFWVQKAYTPRNLILIASTTILGLALLYGTAEFMPAAVQRAISFLPGIEVDSNVAADAAATWSSRIETTRRGAEMIPDYWLLGRGFTRYADLIPNSREVLDSVAYAVLQGYFLNGFVGLMVNTGLLGTLGLSIFLFAGARLAGNVVGQARAVGFESTLARTASVVASLYFVDLVFFFLLEGNVDWALSRFGMYVGILFACERLLRERLLAETETTGLTEPEPAR